MDVLIATRQWVTLADTEFAAHVGENVFAVHLPIEARPAERPRAFDNTKPGVVFNPVGGSGPQRFRADIIPISFTLYGGAVVNNGVNEHRPELAMQTYSLLRDHAIQHRRAILGEAKLMFAVHELGPLPIIDPETGWPTVTGQFRLCFVAKE